MSSYTQKYVTIRVFEEHYNDSNSALNYLDLASLTSIDIQMNLVRFDVKGAIDKIDQSAQQLKLLAGEFALNG
jgi:hypothetical protein